MANYAYQYDPTASIAANLVANERHALADYPNKWGSIIPVFAPFYRKDLVVKHVPSGRVLLEGLDYYLGHRFAEATTANKLPVYGSIMVLDKTLAGQIEFEQYRTLGGPHLIPHIEALGYLAREDNPDPRNADWVEVMKFPRAVEVIDAPTDIADAIARDAITYELDVIQATLQRLSAEEQTAYLAVMTSIAELGDRIHDYDVAHHEGRRDPHAVTYAQLNAIKKDGTAVNAIKAYGYTLAQLVEYVENAAVKIEDKEVLARLVGDTLQGRLRLDGNTFMLQGTNGASTLDLKNGTLNIVATSNLTVITSLNESRLPVGLQSGMNSLSIHADADIDVDSPLIYNGFYVIHAGNIAEYMPSVSGSDQRIHAAPGDGITLRGQGTAGIPLTGDVSLVEATETTPGVFELSTSVLSTSTTVVATPSALQQIVDLQAPLVPTSRRVNGKPLTGNLTFSKGEFGLARVNNTSPNDKPVSTAFTQAVADKAVAGHGHSLADLEGLDQATPETRGLVRLATALSDDTDSVVTTSVVAPLEAELVDVENDLYETVPAGVFDVVKFGNDGYLPMPVSGSYPASGINPDFNFAVGLIETDGRLVFLRNGADLTEKGVYYVYATIGSDGGFDRFVPTTYRYQPAYLSANQTVEMVGIGSEDVFTAKMADGTWHLVLTRGTMDPTAHVGAEVVTGGGGIPIDSNTKPVVYQDQVYYLQTDITGTGPWVRLWRVPIADILTGGIVTPTVVPLSGTNAYGDVKAAADIFTFTNSLVSLDIADKPFVVRDDDGYWSVGFNVKHWSLGIETAMQNGILRVYVGSSMYAYNTTTSRGMPYGYSYTIDLQTYNCRMDNPELVPMFIRHNGAYSEGTIENNIPLLTTNYYVNTIHSKGRTFGFRYYTNNNVTSRIYPFISQDNTSTYFDHLHANVKKATAMTGMTLTGPRGSVAVEQLMYLGFIGNNKLIGAQRDGSRIIVEFDPTTSFLGPDGGGFGPTANRRLIPLATYTAMLPIARLFDGSSTPRNAGTTFLTGGITNWTKCVDETLSQPVTYPNAVKNAIDNSVKADLASLYSNGSLLEHASALVMFGDPNIPGDTDYFIVSAFVYQLQGEINKRSWRAIHRVSVTIEGNTIVSIELNQRIVSVAVSDRATSIRYMAQWNGNYRIRDGVITRFIFGTATYIGHSSGSYAQSAIVTNSNGNWTAASFGLSGSQASGYHYHQELGVFTIAPDNTGETIYAHQRTFDNLSAVWDSVPIHSTRVVSGWVIYVTEEVPFYYAGIRIQLPIVSYDLTTLFPGEYQNTTFYIYVTVTSIVNDSGVEEITGASYMISKESTEDTYQQYYVGYCRTDATQIVELNVESMMRYGNIQELEEHRFDLNAHDGLLTINKDKFNAGYVQNMPMLSTLTLPTFQEVFDTWKRFVHWHTTDAQPAAEGPLTAWEYLPAEDVLRSKGDAITQHMFVGFISPQPVGDYTFDVKLMSPDADDDWIGIVLAYAVDSNGREHTLSALRSTGGEWQEIVSGQFYNCAVVKNWRQPNHGQRVISTARPGKDGGWGGKGTCRIKAVRKNNVIDVTFYEFSSRNADAIIHTTSIDLNAPDLQIFKGAANFGFCSQSQGLATFDSNVRPDEDVGNYYATGELVRLAAERQATTVTFRQGVVVSGQAVPIPPGFTAANCKVMVDYHDVADATTVKTEFRISCNPTNLIVTVQYHNGTDWVTTGASAKYYLVARKPI